MAIKITEDCINCGACEPECPNNAIYEGGFPWKWSDGTKLLAKLQGESSQSDMISENEPFSIDTYYIVPGKCTECVGFFDEPQCASVCPVNCCVLDLDNLESHEDLLKKKQRMHD